MAQTVIGIFENAAEAQNAIQALVTKGFSRDNIDISSPVSNTNPGTQSSERLESTDFNRDSSNTKYSDYDDNEKEFTYAGSQGVVLKLLNNSNDPGKKFFDEVSNNFH